MTTKPVVGGIRFLTSVDIDDASDEGFSDLDIPVEWVTDRKDLVGHPVKAPLDLTVWFDEETITIRLPRIHDNTVAWAWQLRQVAPIVAAWHERLTIHASAVAIDDRIVAFVGESGAGKSTLAWELVKAGAAPVADDLLPIRFNQDTQTNTPPMVDTICFLSREGDEPRLTPVPRIEVLTQHLAHGFGEHEDPRVWAYQFDAYHRLTTEVDHFVLTLPDDRSRVAHAATWLIGEFDRDGSD